MTKDRPRDRVRQDRFLSVTFLTILAYRIWTYTVIYFWGDTAWWHGVYTDAWNHYQLGILLLLAGILGRRYKPQISVWDWIVPIGTGMVIDEIADVIRLLHLFALPRNFRDSPADLLLIAGTYAAFAVIFILLSRNRKSPRGKGI